MARPHAATLPGAATSLRDSLIAALLRFSGGPSAVRTALCLSLAALAAHTPPAGWGHPDGALGALTQRIGGEAREKALPCLLQLLVVLPQEAGSFRPAIRPERRRAYAAELTAAAPSALQLLSQLHGAAVSGGNAEGASSALEAYGSWVWLSCSSDGASGPAAWQPGAKRCPPPGCDPASLAQHPLTAAALQGLSQPQTFDAAVDAVVELIRAAAPSAASEDGGPVSPAYAGVDPQVAPLVAALIPPIMALRGAFPNADDDAAKGMARLFAEVGEAFVELIATGAQEALAPVEALLAVSAHPEDEVAAVSYEFWCRLAACVLDCSLGGAEVERRRSLFAPAFAQLVRHAQGRVRYPPGFAEWRRDARAQFKRERSAVGDALLQAAKVLGGEATLGILAQPLAQLAAASAPGGGGGGGGGGGFDWRAAEAALYCVRSVAPASPPPDCALLAQLLSSLHTLPAVGEVQYTACLTAGAYADWIAAAVATGTPQATDLLPRLLHLITAALSAPGDAPGAAALSLRNLCDACAQQLAPLAPQMLQLYARVTAADAGACGGGGAGAGALPGLDEGDVVEVASALARLVAAQPHAHQLAAMEALLSPPLSALEALLPAREPAQQQQPPSAAVVRQFDRVAAVLRCSDAPEAAAAVFLSRVWPLTQRALQRCAEERACERACRALKYALRAAGAQRCAPVLPPACQLISGLFSQRRHACLLFAATELLRAFAPDPQAAQHLTALLLSLFAHAQQALPSLGAFDAAPDVVDDLFLLADRALKLLPSAVFDPAALAALLAMAATGCGVQHREACQSLLLFTAAALQRRGPQELAALAQALPPRGPALARALLTAALVTLPPARIPDVAEALHALLQLAQQAALGWLNEAMHALPEAAAPHCDVALLAGCAAAVATQGEGAPRVRQLGDALDELAQVCRRNRHAFEATHMALLGEPPLPPPPLR